MDWELPDEPKVSLRDEIKPMRENVPVGRLGIPFNREPKRVFVKKVTRGNPPDDAEHYYVHIDGYEDGGYAMSQDIIDQLELHDAELVFIYEEDTDTVLEFKLESFSQPTENEVYGNQPQLVAPESEAEYRWDGVGTEMFTNDSFWSKK